MKNEPNIIKPIRIMSFSDLLHNNQPGETSVYIKSNDGHTEKHIRIFSYQDSRNVEIEYKEEENHYSSKGK